MRFVGCHIVGNSELRLADRRRFGIAGWLRTSDGSDQRRRLYNCYALPAGSKQFAKGGADGLGWAMGYGVDDRIAPALKDGKAER